MHCFSFVSYVTWYFESFGFTKKEGKNMTQIQTEDIIEFVYNRLGYINKLGLSTNVNALRTIYTVSLC